MIRIVIDRGKLSLRVSGHSGYAEPGKDIVCAGVSALVRTWERCVQLFLDQGWLEDAIVEIDQGGAVIVVYPVDGMRGTIDVAFLTIGTGLERICEECGEYASMEFVRD